MKARVSASALPRIGLAVALLSWVLVLFLGLIWQGLPGSRAQKPLGGMTSVAVQPDEGLRASVHISVKRADDRLSSGSDMAGILPPPGLPTAATAEPARPFAGHAVAAPATPDLPPARAPPVAA